MRRPSAFAVAVFATLSLVLPAMASPEGIWEIESRDSRYDVTLCGDGTELCAELIWLGRGADNRENRPYLNTMLIDEARPAKPGQWKGQLHLFGLTADGTITQVSEDRITLKGCVAWVVCKTVKMHRYDD